jgi:hypothetical protein
MIVIKVGEHYTFSKPLQFLIDFRIPPTEVIMGWIKNITLYDNCLNQRDLHYTINLGIFNIDIKIEARLGFYINSKFQKHRIIHQSDTNSNQGVINFDKDELDRLGEYIEANYLAELIYV